MFSFMWYQLHGLKFSKVSLIPLGNQIYYLVAKLMGTNFPPILWLSRLVILSDLIFYLL